MPQYVYACEAHGEFDEFHRIGRQPDATRCKACAAEAKRVYTVPYFLEDRTRFYRGPDGSRYCANLGTDMPDSRREAEVLAKSKGIEFMTRDEVPAHIRNAQAYGAHLKSGGDRLDNAAAAELLSPPKEKPKSIVELLREKAPRLGEIPTDRPIAGVKLPDFPKDIV
jgi:putative FmdB family regulatory protein